MLNRLDQQVKSLQPRDRGRIGRWLLSAAYLALSLFGFYIFLTAQNVFAVLAGAVFGGLMLGAIFVDRFRSRA